MTVYLIWSNQKRAWWRGNERGYTGLIEEAGRYTRARAERIVAKATCDGRLARQRNHPVTGEDYVSLDEVMVLAPEATP